MDRLQRSARGRCARGATLLFVVAAWVCAGASANAATYTVDPGPLTIHAAMDQAANGDSVLLRPGTYFLGKSAPIKAGVVLKSIAGAQVTILDAAFRGFPGLIARDVDVPAVIEGITFTHGASPTLLMGGGILSFSSSLTVRNCVFFENDAASFEGLGGFGSAIAVIGGAPTIENNTIVRNFGSDGAIFIQDTRALVRGNVIAHNSSGLTCLDAAGSTLTHNLFWMNGAVDIDPSCGASPQGNYFEDPLFCAPASGDLRVQTRSPIAPGGPHSGLGVFIGTCDPVPAQSASWGRMKANYR